MVAPLRNVDKVTMAAALLKAAAPNRYGEFIDALRNLSNERNAECVQAPADGVLKAQGKAIQLQELFSVLVNCTETAETLHEKMKPKEKT